MRILRTIQVRSLPSTCAYKQCLWVHSLTSGTLDAALDAEVAAAAAKAEGEDVDEAVASAVSADAPTPSPLASLVFDPADGITSVDLSHNCFGRLHGDQTAVVELMRVRILAPAGCFEL